MITIKVEGLEELTKRIQGSPRVLQGALLNAMGRSMAMMETESKIRTPKDTGNLRSSIGGSGGFKRIGAFESAIGTNVGYAVFVHEGHARHKIGERKFMEKGAKAAEKFVTSEFQKVAEIVAKQITR